MFNVKSVNLVCLLSIVWATSIAYADCASDPANLLTPDVLHNCNFDSGIPGWTGSVTPVFNTTDQGCPSDSGVNSVQSPTGGSIRSQCINISDLPTGTQITWGASLARIGGTASNCQVLLRVYGNDTCAGSFQFLSQPAASIGTSCTAITGTFTPGPNAAVIYDLRCASGTGTFIGDNLFLFLGDTGMPVDLQSFTIE